MIIIVDITINIVVSMLHLPSAFVSILLIQIIIIAFDILFVKLFDFYMLRITFDFN
jgi:hypothetical protein